VKYLPLFHHFKAIYQFPKHIMSLVWALSLFYQFNCWANIYFQEGKKMHRSINLINIEKKVFKKLQHTCFRVQNSSWTYDEGSKKI